MSICRCLFWKYKDETAVVALSDNGLEALRFIGKVFCSFSGDFNDFWCEWRQQISYESSQETDFCVISDGSLEVPEELMQKQCGIEQSQWKPDTISEAIALLNPPHCVTVRTASGFKIADYSVMFPHDEPSELTADFPAASQYSAASPKPKRKISNEKNAASEPLSEEDVTPLAREFISRLKNDEKRRTS